MRGLTPLEAKLLNDASAHCTDGSRTQLTDEERKIFRTLVEQGRVRSAPCPCHGISVITITKEGLEALALWREIQKRLEDS